MSNKTPPITYTDFSKGLVDSVAPDNMDPAELVQADNIDLSERGGFKMRMGTLRLSETSYTANIGQIIEWSKNNGTVITLVMAGTTLKILNSDGTLSTLKSGLNSTQIGYCFYVLNGEKMFFVDGLKYYEWRGMGVDIGGSSPSTDISGGTATTFQIACDADVGTSTYHSVTLNVTGLNTGAKIAAALQAGIRAIGTAYDDVVVIYNSVYYIYSGTNGLNSKVRIINGATNDVATTLKIGAANGATDVDGDTVLEVTPDSDVTNDLEPIKRCKFLVFHPKSSRIFAAGDSLDPAALYFSEYGKPNFFAATNKLYPISGDGPITGLTCFMSALLSFYKRSIYAWKGSDPATDATWGKIPVPYGTSAPNSIVNTPVSLTFLSDDALISIQPGVLEENVVLVANTSYVLNLSEKRIDGLISSILHPETACAVYAHGVYYLAYGDDIASSYNNRVLVFDWKLGAFTRYTGLQVNCFCHRYNGDLIFGSLNKICKTNTGYSDDGVIIAMAVKTMAFGLKYPFNLKKVKKILIAARQYYNQLSNINLVLKGDRLSNNYAISLDESVTWGEVWGDRVWGWDELITKEGSVGIKAKRFQITITNTTVGQPCTIYGIGFISKLRKPKGVRRGVTVS